MKKAAGKLLLIALVSITACKKDIESTQLQGDLAGSWELSKLYVYTNVNGGVIAYETGNGNTITFNNDNHFSQTVVNTDTAYSVTGTYTVQNEDNCGINLLIKRDNSTGTYNYHVSVHLDSLIMSAGNCIADAGTYIYLRKL